MENDFARKKIAVLGLSTEGTETVKYLISQKAKVSACDKKKKEKLPKGIIKTLKKLSVKLKLGPSYLDGLEKYDIVFRTPGMPLWHPKLQEAKKRGTKIESLTRLFFKKCPSPIIGVTGTKGKGTTASLIGEILREDGKKVFVGGNIGEPLINDISKMSKDSWVVLELSSFQLEDLSISPHIAVVLNITTDHLASGSSDSPNYHRSWQDYLLSKRNIVVHQKGTDFAVLNADYKISYDFKNYTSAQIWYFSKTREIKKGAFVQKKVIWLAHHEKKEKICKVQEVLLRGEHNLENITASATAAFLAGAKTSSTRKAILNFKGLEHRLELVRTADGVSYYNDSFSTTPETAIAAIKSFRQPIILIAGGSEKGADFSKLGEEIASRNVKKVILMGQMTGRIEEAIKKTKKFKKGIIKNLNTMKEIVYTAKKIASCGDIVLLSPACASFDMFQNYKDRGNQFKHEVRNL